MYLAYQPLLIQIIRNSSDFNGDVDIDGHTELDNVNVSDIHLELLLTVLLTLMLMLILMGTLS